MKRGARILSVLVAACILTTLLPAGTLAVESGDAGFSVEAGDFILRAATGLAESTDYEYSGRTLTVKTDTAVTISMKDGVTQTATDKIAVQSGVTADITLDSVNIDVSGINTACAFDLTGAEVTLTLAGTNTLKSGYQKAGVLVPADSALTIEGDGKLTARGGEEGNRGGAGIGADDGGSCGAVTIRGGTVDAMATGRGGAGIGLGGWGGVGGSIAISGGCVVSAGGGNEGSFSSDMIAITGGIVLAADDKLDPATKENCIVYQNCVGRVYGATELSADHTVQEGYSLTIPAECTLVVPAHAALTVDGTVIIEENGTFTNNGTATNNGSVINAGTVNGSAEIGGNPILEPGSTVDRLLISNGSIRIEACGSGGFSVEQTGNRYQGNSENSLTITGESAANTIQIGENVTAQITMDGLNVDLGYTWDTASALQIEAGAAVAITLVGDNRLKGSSGNQNISGGDGIHCVDSAALTIDGAGSLSCVGGDGGNAANGTGGWGGAGIRGNATMTSGKIQVVGGYSGDNRGYDPGGSRAGGNGFDGTLTMRDGEVTAIGGQGNNSNNTYFDSGNGGTGITALVMSGGAVHATGGDSGRPAGRSGSKGNGVNAVTPDGGILVAQGGTRGDGGGQGVATLNAPQNCIVFSNGTGELYGDYTLNGNFEVAADKTLSVGSGETLTIADGATLTNKGTINIDGGTIKNHGTVKNIGTISGAVDGGGDVKVPSTVSVTFHGASGDALSYAVYGESVTFVATVAEVPRAGNVLPLCAEENTVNFYLGGKEDGTRLGTAEVTDRDGVPTAELLVGTEVWEKGLQVGANTITADFGGTSGLLENVGSAVLTVKESYAEEAFLSGRVERRYDKVTLLDAVSGVWYLCTTSSEKPAKDAAGWTQAGSDHVSFGDLTLLTDYYLWCYVPETHEHYAETEVCGPIAVSTTDGPWTCYADISWYENAPYAASYTLTTPAQLAGTAKLDSASLSGKTLYLGADMDLSAHEWQPAALEKATLDGQGHTVTGMKVTGNNDDGRGVGLFSELDGAVLQNFTVSGEITGGAYAGGVVGRCYDSSIINVGSLVNIFQSGTAVAGGVAGIAEDTTVCNSYAMGNITAADGGRIENAYFGGIVGGSTKNCSIQNCYYYGALTGAGNVGGITAHTERGDEIMACWSNVSKTGVNSEDGQKITDAAALTEDLNDYDLLRSIRERCGLNAVPWTLAAGNSAWPVPAAPQRVNSQPTADCPLIAVTSSGDSAYQWQTKEPAKTAVIALTVNDPHYAWTDRDGVWQSANHADNSSSLLKVEYAVEEGGRIAFDWKVSSENRYDVLEYALAGPQAFSMEGQISGTDRTEFARVEHTGLAAGTYTLQVRYRKDASDTAGCDCGWINLLPGDWRSIDGFTENSFPAGDTYTGAQIRCLVTYPWGETLISDRLTAKAYQAVTFDSRNGEPAFSYSAARNSLIVRPTDPTRAGYAFGGWYNGTADSNAWDFAKDIVTDDVTLYARWTPNSSGGSTSNRPSVKVEGAGGTVRAGNGSVTITPDEGYRIGRITVNGKETDIPESGRLTGLKGSDKVIITFEKIPGKPTVDMGKYTDVAPHAWYFNAVQYVVEHGLFAGTSETAFSPDDDMTRAMLVTVLYRAAGEPSIEDEIWGYPFADVDAESWYGTAVYWARLRGITSGTSAETYSPDSPITREQLAVMLYRYAGSPAAAGTLEDFPDAHTADSYATEALRWAEGLGIITGMENGILDPKGEVTRAQTAVVLMRYLENE